MADIDNSTYQDFQIIIDKATEKDPYNRYQSCDELLEAIEELEDI